MTSFRNSCRKLVKALPSRALAERSQAKARVVEIQNLEAIAPEADWEALDCTSLAESNGQRGTYGLQRDLPFVDLGRYLCEVRAGQYWRLEKMKSFDDSQAAWSVVLDCGSLLRTPKRLRNWF